MLLSSTPNHAWNPGQRTPATDWEREIDRHMHAQAAELDYRVRKKHFPAALEIVAQQAPMIFLVHPNARSAKSSAVAGPEPSAFFPHTFWNAEWLTLAAK